MNDFMYKNEREEINLPAETVYLLKDAATWGKVLSILGFIGLGIFVLFTIIVGIVSGGSDYVMGFSFKPGLFVFLCLIVAAIFFFPNFFLFQASSRIQKAIATNDSYTLTCAVDSLKSHFLFRAIISMVGLVLMLAAFFGTIFTAICC